MINWQPIETAPKKQRGRVYPQGLRKGIRPEKSCWEKLCRAKPPRIPFPARKDPFSFSFNGLGVRKGVPLPGPSNPNPKGYN